MKRIGLIGEDPNDTIAIKNLLVKKYPGLFICEPLLRNERGNNLDTKKYSARLKIEFEDIKPDIVIFVRDVDGILTEDVKIRKVRGWFDRLNGVVNNKGILLHNIYELEALILADIETFNRLYGTTLKSQGNVMHKQEPKEFLIRETRKVNLRKVYSPSDCPKIFNELNFDKLVKRCVYFKDFNAVFTKILKIN